VKEVRHFRNKLLCVLLATKPKEILSLPKRLRFIWVYEKVHLIINLQEHVNTAGKLYFIVTFVLGGILLLVTPGFVWIE
jgi:hypothetical protein